jgi:hypothetical protein
METIRELWMIIIDWWLGSDPPGPDGLESGP